MTAITAGTLRVAIPWRFGAWSAAVSLIAVMAATWVIALRAGFIIPPFGADLDIYRDAAVRWLSGGSYFQPYQFAPYSVWASGQEYPVLYPPTALPLFAAFTFVPAVLWWAIPLGIIGWVTACHRPSPLALALVVALLLAPPNLATIWWTGNPAMWAVAALSLATVRPTFAPLVLLKPTLGPFALWGIHDRSWWIGLAAFGAVSLAFLPMWADYVAVIRNGDAGALYSLWQWPVMLVPVAIWIGRRR